MKKKGIMISNDSIDEQQLIFNLPDFRKESVDFLNPKTYSGLASFHKYWGKKPIESITFLINKFSREGDIILDPFFGSGLIAKECLLQNRKFVGMDINPFSYEYATFLLNLPTKQDYFNALNEIEDLVSGKINESYITSDNQIASHYLWEKDQICSIWIKPKSGRQRIEIKPSEIDFTTFSFFNNYQPKEFRDFKFFKNSRINVKPTMTAHDIFTGRAIRNIDLLIEAISSYPPHLKRALLLTLTSSSGQMSNMVFAIRNRKKTGNNNRIEVGSWVIGYWLPETHFEINVWNCFKNRANKLLKSLPIQSEKKFSISEFPPNNEDMDKNAWLINSDCRITLRQMPSEIVTFVCTDPPHSDRMPYLELSELWNSLLGYSSEFEKEIVVSDAKERGKSKEKYNSDMVEFFIEVTRVLKPNGYIALYFNARDAESWQFLRDVEFKTKLLKFIGCFPMVYSATSVIQDNRKGAMKSDYIIIYQKTGNNLDDHSLVDFTNIPGWTFHFPNAVEIEK